MTGKKKKNFGGDIDVEVIKAFDLQVEERGYIKKRAVEGAAKFWIKLPAEVQTALMAGGFDDSNSLVPLVRQVILDLKESGEL